MKFPLVFGLLGILANYGLTNAADANTCVTQAPCLTYSEGPCVSGSRMVCLGQNASAVGCSLTVGNDNDTIDNLCALVGGNPFDSKDTATDGIKSTCASFPANSLATFAVSDNMASSGSVAAVPVPVAGSPDIKTGSCIAEHTARCIGFTPTSTNTLWTFNVTSCSCSCSSWSAFSPCSSTCQQIRWRSCTSPSSDLSCPSPETETKSCSGDECIDCSCTPSWSEWSSCSTTCGGTRSRSIECQSNRPGVSCTNVTDTQPCSGNNTCSVTTTTDSSTNTTSAPGCVCTPFTGGSCSATCGLGVITKSRTCSASCPSDVELTEDTVCNSRRRCRRRRPRRRRRSRRCNRLATRKARQRCRRSRKN